MPQGPSLSEQEVVRKTIEVEFNTHYLSSQRRYSPALGVQGQGNAANPRQASAAETPAHAHLIMSVMLVTNQEHTQLTGSKLQN